MRKLHLGLAAAVTAAPLFVGPANASILNWTQVNAWQGATPGATSTSATQQALPTATGTLTLALTSSVGGPLNFNLPAGGTDTIPGFFATAGTTLLPGDFVAGAGGATNVMSASNFTRVTIMEFTFTDTAVETLTILHDDGVSLFAQGSNVNLLPAGASAPTTASLTTLNNFQPGTYNLWYAAANNLPEDLIVNSIPNVPIPGTLPLFATGVAGLGLLWRRKRKAQAVA
jgi:hypothetical protein